MGMVGGGLGSFVGGVHRLAAALDGDIELVAGVFSRDWENTKATGARLYLDPGRLYGSFEEMAAAEAALPPDRRIDFVTIVTPNNSHFEPAQAFLEAGFHVVCDKPLALCVKEADRLVRTVEETGLVFALTHNYTGYPLVRHARQLFQSGELGVVRKVIVEYLQDWLMVPLEKDGSKQASWRTNPAESGVGGAVGDIGTHALNLLEYVIGEQVTALCADTATFLPDRTLDEDVNALLRLRGGGKGILTVSQIATGEENNLRLRVYASAGALVWEQERPNSMDIYRHGKARETLTRGHVEYLSAAATTATRVPPGLPEGYLEAFANVYQGIVNAIRCHINGKPLPPSEYDFPTVRDGLRGMQFIEKVVRSAAAGGAWIVL
jgi:predicted dehydrogenase